MNEATIGRLGDWLGATLGTSIRTGKVSKLTGGAIQENWLVSTEGAGDLVIRTDAPSGVATSHSRE